MLLNLLSNAVKFTGDEGRVESTSRRSTATTLTVTVTDNGLGVAPEDRERIFESFEQGTRGPPRTEGTGLGLTLSKRIVELHGGRIWLDSEVGVGSTFGFTIPLRSDPTVGERRRRDSGTDGPFLAHGCHRRGRPTVARAARAVPRRDGRRRRRGARDGQEGLEVVRRLHPAAVVLDLYLPKLDGWDVLALLKADQGTSAIPVIIVSMVDERGKGFALGAADYLVKPVGREEVLAALNRALALPESQPSVVAIDDDPKALALVTAVLEREGWTVLQRRRRRGRRRPGAIAASVRRPGRPGDAGDGRLRCGGPRCGADPETSVDPDRDPDRPRRMTREDKERLRGQISYVANKGEFDSGDLAELVDGDRLASAAPAPEAP